MSTNEEQVTARKPAGPGVGKIAKAVGLKPRTVRSMIDSGEGPAFKLANRWYAWPEEWQALMVADRAPAPEPEPTTRRRRRFPVTTEGRAAP